MYRVYNLVNKVWVNEVFMFPNGTLFKLKKRFFCGDKLSILSKNNHVVHRFTLLYDRRGEKIYEGDLCVELNGDKHNELVVAYSSELGAYCFVDADGVLCAILNADSADDFVVVGNVFDGTVDVDDVDER